MTRKINNDRLKREYEQGATVRSLAARYGISYGAAHHRLVVAGTQLRRRGGPELQLDEALLVELDEAGWSARAIARHVGCTPHVIRRRLALLNA